MPECVEPCIPREDDPRRYRQYCLAHWRTKERERSKIKYLRYRETIKLRTNAHHKVTRKEKQEAYQRNKDKECRKTAEWTKNNPIKHQAKNHRYRARKRDALGSWTETQLQARVAFYGGRCYLCGCDWDALPRKKYTPIGKRFKTIDHVIALNRGGTNWPSNIRPACSACNCGKLDKALLV